MKTEKKVLDEKNNFYSLERARRVQSSIGGKARVEKYGRDAMREMGKKSRQVPSKKRDAYNLAQRMLTAHRLEILAHYTGKRNICYKCHRPILNIRRENIVPHSWNYPLDTTIVCGRCLTWLKIKPITEHFADILLRDHKKLST